MLSTKRGSANTTPVQNFRVWSAISARRASASASSMSSGAASTTPYPAASMARAMSFHPTAPATTSTTAFSVAKFTDADTTPGTRDCSVRSMVVAQLAHVIPVMGSWISLRVDMIASRGRTRRQASGG